jgi:hypothetical protein
MGIGVLLKIFVIVLGCYLLLMALLSLAKRRMTELFCLAWGVLSALMIIAAVLLKPYHLERFISIRTLFMIMTIIIGIVWGMWFISTQVSLLMRKNQELAMQISLLNQDNEKILKELEDLQENLKKNDEKNTFCD